MTLFGEPYHDDPGTGEIVDVRLRPPDGLLDMKDRHRYATAWYAASALHHSAGVGYGWNRWARPDRTARRQDAGAQTCASSKTMSSLCRASAWSRCRHLSSPT